MYTDHTPSPQYIYVDKDDIYEEESSVYGQTGAEENDEMRRFALKEETDEFAAKVMALVAPRYASRWRDRVERLWIDVQERGFAERTDATKKLYMSRFRKAVREALAEAEPDEARRARVEEALMEVIRIDPQILNRLHEAYQAKVMAANADLILVPEWEWLVKTFRLMLTDEDAELRAIALMALTGRRFEEVLRAGDFAPSLDKTERGHVRHRWLLDFTGQLKTRSGKGEGHDDTFRIPVLAPAFDVLRAFRRLRASPQGREWASASKRQLSTTFNPEFNRKLQGSPAARFWPKGASLTLKELRALYAEIAYVNFAPRTTRAPYYARILGHSEDDLTTALSYMRYSLSKEALREGQEEMNRLTMLREQRREEAREEKRGEGGEGGEEGDEELTTPAQERVDELIED